MTVTNVIIRYFDSYSQRSVIITDRITLSVPQPPLSWVKMLQHVALGSVHLALFSSMNSSFFVYFYHIFYILNQSRATIGRYRQGQHTLMTPRSQGQSQSHEGHFCFYRFSWISPTVLIGKWLFSTVKHSNASVGHLGPCWVIYYQRWLNIADPTSLDVFSLDGYMVFMSSSLVPIQIWWSYF